MPTNQTNQTNIQTFVRLKVVQFILENETIEEAIQNELRADTNCLRLWAGRGAGILCGVDSVPLSLRYLNQAIIIGGLK